MCLYSCYFQACDGLLDAHYGLEFRRVHFRYLICCIFKLIVKIGILLSFCVTVEMSELLIGFGTGCSRTQRLILCRLSSRFTHLPKCTTISARSDTVGSFLALTVTLRLPSTAALTTWPHAVTCRIAGLSSNDRRVGRKCVCTFRSRRVA